MAPTATARRAPKQATVAATELLTPSELQGVLTIPQDALIAWAAAKLGCEPKRVKVLGREEQHDLTFHAPDLNYPKTTRTYRVRVVYDEANRLEDARVTVMLHGHEWGASPPKGRHNLAPDPAAEIVASRGWTTERKGRRR